jgi:uncharacterized protein (DUF952 family)
LEIITLAHVYKICTQAVWHDALAKGVFVGATIDLTDGFIHLSTAVQAPVTASLFFKTGDDLVLVGFDDQTLKGLKYEPSRGGELFPHVFGTIDTKQALSVFRLVRQTDGSLKFPDGFQGV